MKRKRGRGFECVLYTNKRRKTGAGSFVLVPVPMPRQSPVSVSFTLLLKYSTVKKKYKKSYRSFLASLPSIAEQLEHEPEEAEAPGVAGEDDEEEAPPTFPLEAEDPPPIVEELPPPREPLLGSFYVCGVRRSRRLEGRVVSYVGC